MATDYFGNNIATGQKKKKPLSTQNANDPNQVIQLSPDAMSGAGNRNVLQQAQTQVLNQPTEKSPLQKQVTQQATDYVSKPMGDFDPQKAKQAQIDKYNADWAKSFENMRRQYGGSSGSGLVQQDALNNILQRNIDRGALETAIDTENLNRYQNAMTSAIGTGADVNKMNEDIFSQRLGNLATVRGMAEGERSQAQAQQNAIDLQNLGYDQTRQLMAEQQGYDLEKMDKAYGNDVSKMILQNDWQGAQAELDRQMQYALQSNDINLQKEIQDKQNAFQFDFLKAQNDWQGAQAELERQMRYALQTNDADLQRELQSKENDFKIDYLKAQNDWQGAQAELDRQMQYALQYNDFYAQKELQDKQNSFQIDYLTAQQDFQGVENELNRQLELAMQSNDIETQKTLLEKQYTNEISILETTQDWQGEQNRLNRNLEESINSDNIASVQANLQAQLALDEWKTRYGGDITVQQNALDRALSISLSDMDKNAQLQAIELKGRIDSNQITQSQDWEAIQNDIDRQMNIAMQVNDIDAQRNLELLRGQISEAAQLSEYQFRSAERIATQAWTTSERLDEQDWQEAMQWYDYKFQEASQNNDINAQIKIQNMRSNLELAMQTSDFSQQEKMAYISYELNEAVANNDVDRQYQLIQFQTGSDMAKMREQYGYEAAMNEAKFQYNMALQTDNNIAAAAIQQMSLEFQAQENAKNRTLQELELQMQQSGIDMAEREQQWEMIKDAVSSYQADPSAMVEYLNNMTNETGITIKPPDTTDIYKQSLVELNGLKNEYAVTHPNEVDESGSLTDEGEKNFNQFYNEAIWGEQERQGLGNVKDFVNSGFRKYSIGGDGSYVEVDDTLKNRLNNLIGQESTITDATNGQKISGQIQSWKTTPNTVQVTISDNNGNLSTIPIYWDDKRSLGS